MKIEKLNEKVDWKVAIEGNNSNIDRLRNVATQVNIDPVMGEVVRENEESDKQVGDTFKKLSKELDGVTPKNPDTGKKVTIKPYTEKLSLDESLFKESWTSFGGSWRDQTVKRVNYEEDDISDIAYELMNWYGEYFEGWEGPDIKDALYGLDGERIPGSDCPIIFTMEESEEDAWDEDEEYDEPLKEKKSSKKKKHLCESSSDGWNEEVLYDVTYILDKLQNINYEINSCVRGAYSNCKTYSELGKYLEELGDSLSNLGEEISEYEEDSDDEDVDESLNEAKSKQPKFWNSIFATKVIDAYKNGKLTMDNIDDWETEYNGGVKPTNMGTREILTYHMNTGKDPRNESLEKKSLSENWIVEPEATLRTKNGDELTIKDVSFSVDEYTGKVRLKVEYDYVLTNGKSGHNICYGDDISYILKGKLSVDEEPEFYESMSLKEYVDEDEVEEDDYTVIDLLNDRLFGYGINKSNFRQKWKFAEVEPSVKTSKGTIKRGYFYPTIHADELVTGKPDDRRAFVDNGVGVFVYDEDEASLAKKCAEELKLDFDMKKLVRPVNGFNYIAVIKVPDEIQEMPLKDYVESIGKSMKDFLRGRGEKVKSDFTGSANYTSRKEKEE